MKLPTSSCAAKTEAEVGAFHCGSPCAGLAHLRLGNLSARTRPLPTHDRGRLGTRNRANATNPMGYQTTYAYNAAGLLTSTTDADGRTIDYGYNAIGQKTSETWVNGNYTATYQYNGAGELTSASDPSSTYTYTYDAAGRLTSVSNTGTPGVPTVTLSYTYDAYGNRTSLTDSLGGQISYSYDSDERLSSLGLYTGGSNPTLDAQVTFGYDAASRLTSLSRSPSSSLRSFTRSLSYDNANELTNITDSAMTALSVITLTNYTYGYDAAGNLTSYQDNNNSLLSYSYDANGELTGASGTLNGSSYSVSYSYDANGNRNMTGYTTGKGNELTSDGTYNYTYDNNGNMTSQTRISDGQVTNYTWDYRNRLTEVIVKDNLGNVLNDEKFTYDVNNNRIAVTLNGTVQLYTVYDGANPYIDFNGSGTLTQRYMADPRALSQFFGQVSGSGTVQWFLTDNINSIRQVVDSNGNVLDAITYDPYGNILNQTNASNAPRFLYTGGAYDSITGTYLDGEREDNPEDGRWLSQDPLGLKPDSNPYRYVDNDPTAATDPMGLDTPPGGSLGYGSQAYSEVWWERMKEMINTDYYFDQLGRMREMYLGWNADLGKRQAWYERYMKEVEMAKSRTVWPIPNREPINRMQKQIDYNNKLLDAIWNDMVTIDKYNEGKATNQELEKALKHYNKMREQYEYDYDRLYKYYMNYISHYNNYIRDPNTPPSMIYPGLPYKPPAPIP